MHIGNQQNTITIKVGYVFKVLLYFVIRTNSVAKINDVIEM
jgi:hypothetical protein